VHYDVVRFDPAGSFALEQLASGALVPELDYVRRLAASLSPDADDAARWHEIGAGVVGPFVAAFVEWALDQCEKQGIRVIAPLMREGHMLAPMLRRAAAARNLALDVVPLYVSRQAVGLAGVTSREELLTCLLEDRRHFTVGNLFTLIGLPTPASLLPFEQTYLTSARITAVSPGVTLRDALLEALNAEAAQAHLAGVVAGERRRLVRYLTDTLGGSTRVATLDIGFFGSIQRALDNALRRAEAPVHLLHLLGFGHGPVRERVIAGGDFRVFAGGYGERADLVRTIHRSAPVLEQLLQGHEGSTQGYRALAHGGVEPICADNPLPLAELAAKRVVQGGMETFHELWLSMRRAKRALTSGLVHDRAAWCHMVHRLIDVPTRGEAERLGSLHDDVNYGSDAVLPFCPPAELARVAWIGIDAASRQGAGAISAVWPQGVITQVDGGALASRFADRARTRYFAAAFQVARSLRARAISRVVGYGSGEVATAFIAAAAIMGIEVAALVDSNRARHGHRVAGVEVRSLEATAAMDVPVYVVLSLGNAGPITDTIQQFYAARTVQPLIVHLSTHA
jgi:hypothetical protein